MSKANEADPSEVEIAMQPAGAASLNEGTVKLDLSETLPHMNYRRVFRYHRGAYKQSRPLQLLFLFWVMGCFTLFDSFFVITDEEVTVSFSMQLFSADNVILWTLVVLMIVCFFQNKWQHQYSLQYLVPLLFVCVTIQGILLLTEYLLKQQMGLEEQAEMMENKANWAGFVTIVYIVISSIYVISVAVARHIFPRYAKERHFIPQIIRQKSDKDLEECMSLLRSGASGSSRTAAAAFEYQSPYFWDKKLYECKYSGEVDESGRPSGYGVWSDSDPTGETLEGFWEKGIPVGPFRAREANSGSGFQRMRVGFVSCRAEDVATIECMPKIAPMSVGLASAEPCVSGAFFHEHPLLSIEWEEPDLLAGPAMDELVVKMLDQMITLKSGNMAETAPSSLQVFADINTGISISGFVPEDTEGGSRGSITITIPEKDYQKAWELDSPLKSVPLESSGDGGSPAAAAGDPAATGKALTAATLHTPTTVAPLVSPAGQAMLQDGKKFMSMRMGITRQVATKRFSRQQFEPNLVPQGWVPHEGTKGSEVLIHIHGYNSACQHGIKNVAQLWSFASFPAHIKPVVFSWPTGALFAYPFAQTKGAENGDVALSLREMIISLARAGIRDFHFQTHSMGARMLMYAIPYIEDLFAQVSHMDTELSKEHQDLELTPSEFVGSLRMINVILMNPEYGMHQFAEMRGPILDRICDITTVYGDVNDAALMISYLANNVQSKFMDHHRAKSWLPREVTASQPCRCIWKQRDTCLGLHIYDANDSEGKPLHVDMIDCTFLSSNVQGGRHNAFTLNRSVIEDIYDVVVNRRPAIHRRNRLEPRGGNVYSFLVAPSHIVAP